MKINGRTCKMYFPTTHVTQHVNYCTNTSRSGNKFFLMCWHCKRSRHTDLQSCQVWREDGNYHVVLQVIPTLWRGGEKPFEPLQLFLILLLFLCRFTLWLHFPHAVFGCVAPPGAPLPWGLVVLMCCIFTLNLKLLLLFQADPTEVETVHDVLARAAAKGLLGGIIPEQAKTGKKGKNRKNRVASASSKPSSPSDEDRQGGREELVTGQDPVTPSEGRERGEEGEEHTSEEGEGGKTEKKNRGHKRKLKQQPASKHHPKSHKKKATKKKANQSHPRRHVTKSKPRRIPRLTLTLMSSAKASKQLSPITAVAHKIIDSSVIKSQQTTVFISAPPAGKHLSPAPPAPRAASDKRQTRQADSAEETNPAGLSEARGKVVRPETKVVNATGLVLPPISSPCSSSLRSKSGSSFILPLSQTSHAQLSNTSSSSIYLPGL